MDMSAYRYEVVDVPKDYAPRKRFDEWAGGGGGANPTPPTLSRAVHIESGVWFGDERRMGPHPREMMTFYTLHSGPSEDWSIWLMEKHGLLEVLARQLGVPYKAKTREETDAFKIEHGSIIEYVAYPADQPDIEKLDRDPAMIERLFDLILVHRTQGKLLSTTVAHYDWGGGSLKLKKKRHQYQSGFLRQVFERRVGWD